MAGIHDREYLCLVSTINIFVPFPWYIMFKSAIQDPEFLSVLSIMHNIYSCIHDTHCLVYERKYLWMVATIDNIFVMFPR